MDAETIANKIYFKINDEMQQKLKNKNNQSHLVQMVSGTKNKSFK